MSLLGRTRDSETTHRHPAAESATIPDGRIARNECCFTVGFDGRVASRRPPVVRRGRPPSRLSLAAFRPAVNSVIRNMAQYSFHRQA